MKHGWAWVNLGLGQNIWFLKWVGWVMPTHNHFLISWILHKFHVWESSNFWNEHFKTFYASKIYVKWPPLPNKLSTRFHFNQILTFNQLAYLQTMNQICHLTRKSAYTRSYSNESAKRIIWIFSNPATNQPGSIKEIIHYWQLKLSLTIYMSRGGKLGSLGNVSRHAYLNHHLLHKPSLPNWKRLQKNH